MPTAPSVASGPGWELRLGDCLDPETGLASLPDKSVDHVITDPPYGIDDKPFPTPGRTGKRTGAVNDWHPETDWDGRIDPAWGTEASRLTESIVWFGHWRKRAEVEATILHPLRCEIVWAKDTHVGPPCPVAMQDERIWVFSATGIKAREFATTVWNFPIIPTWAHRDHKNEKPVALMEKALRVFTSRDELVCDPFAGSGTTGVACIRLGRRFIGWERDPKYHAVAVKRLTQAREQLRLFEGTGT